MRLPLLITTCVLGFLVPATRAADWNVVDHGAIGDATTDCTPAFQKALDEAGNAGGGIVNVAAGRYRINGTLKIPQGVTLQGTFRMVPSDYGDPTKLAGSVLLAYAGRGSIEGEPFIRLQGNNSGIAGFLIRYPEWKQTDVPPVAYPPTIASNGTVNTAVIDCCILNGYEAVHFEGAARFLVRNVHGYPSFRGLYVDACYDIGRVENCHFWPYGVNYVPSDPYCKWVNLNGVAFEFARTDWQYVVNTFCFGYGVGYKFSKTKHGTCNGNFLGIGADCCTRAILVEDSQAPGLLITNAELVGRWTSDDSVCIEIAETAGEGKLSLNNCSFWGPIDRCVWARSPRMQFTAIGTQFLQWDTGQRSAPAIQIDAGKTIIQGNNFGDGDLHVQIGPRVQSAILMGNQATGGFRVENQAGKRTQLVANEENFLASNAEAKAHYRIDIGAPGDRAYLRRCCGSEKCGFGDNPDHTMRWSSGQSNFFLPVVPGKGYTVTLEVSVPAAAVDANNGLYLGDTRVLELPAKAFAGTVTGHVPAGDRDQVTLTLRCKTWVPQQVLEKSTDSRALGISLLSLTMKADGAGEKIVNANTGE